MSGSEDRVAALLEDSGPLGDRWLLEREHDEDALGARYRLLDARERDRVGVLRVLSSAASDEQWAEIQVRCERVAALEHPNAARLLDWGRTADGHPWVIYELARGEPLAPLVDEPGGLDARTFVPIAAQILKVVGNAHTHKTPLGTVRPVKVLLSQRNGKGNFVRIDEPGLEVIFRELIPRDDVVRATYEPPEFEEVGHGASTDVYALGALFFRMLTGELPYRGEDVAALREAQRAGPPPDIESRDQQLAPVESGLQALIHSALTFDPERRARNANALVEKLIRAAPASMFKLPPVGGLPTGVEPDSSMVGGSGLLTGAWSALSAELLAAEDEVGRSDWTPGSSRSAAATESTGTGRLRRGTSPGTFVPGPDSFSGEGTPGPTRGARVVEGGDEEVSGAARSGAQRRTTSSRGLPLWAGVLVGMAAVFGVIGIVYAVQTRSGRGAEERREADLVAADPSSVVAGPEAGASPPLVGQAPPSERRERQPQAAPPPAPAEAGAGDGAEDAESDAGLDAAFDAAGEGGEEAPESSGEGASRETGLPRAKKKKTKKQESSPAPASDSVPTSSRGSESGDGSSPLETKKKKSKSSEAFLPVGG